MGITRFCGRRADRHDLIRRLRPSGGKSIALGYVPPEYAKEGIRLEVEILGRKRSATVMAMPLYDPKNEKMKS